MVKDSVGRVNHSITQAPDLKTEIHVIEGHCEVDFIETAYLPENVSFRHETRAGNCTNVPDDVRKIEVMAHTTVQTLKGVATVVIDTHHDARVLDAAVRVQEL